MAPTAQALSRYFRVITVSLWPDPERAVDQIDGALDRAGVDRAVICGVSLGGAIALHYAATRPGRVSALVLTSTPGPRWKLDRIQAFCARYGAVTTPVFVVSSVVRLLPEVVRARGGWLPAVSFMVRHGMRVLTHPASPGRMRQRVLWWLAVDREADARQVSAPTLLITGERELDRVVPVDGSREYLGIISGSQLVRVENTGHIGLVTRADRFAEVVAEFVEHGQTVKAAGRR
jgi:pimeloyl-ACP methyl ester carboxylesterase